MQPLENQSAPISCLVIDSNNLRKEKWRTILTDNFDVFYLAGSTESIEETPKGSKLTEQVDVVFIHDSNGGIWESFSEGEKPKMQAKLELVFNSGGSPRVTGNQLSIIKANTAKDISITDSDIKQVIDYIKDPRPEKWPDMCEPKKKDSDYYWNKLGNREINKVEQKEQEVQEIFEFLFPSKKEE